MIFERSEQNPGARFLLMLASGVVVVWGLQFAAEILSHTGPLDVGITGWVIRNGEAVLANDAHLDSRAETIPGTPEEPESMIVCPLLIAGDVVRLARVGAADIERVAARERQELERRLGRLRRLRPREPLAGRTAVLVDDGIATGATMRAAVAVARAHGATRRRPWLRERFGA